MWGRGQHRHIIYGEAPTGIALITENRLCVCVSVCVFTYIYIKYIQQTFIIHNFALPRWCSAERERESVCCR
jgi:hypothetical protein